MSASVPVVPLNVSNTVALPIGFIDQIARSYSVDEILNAVACWLPQMIQADRASVALSQDEQSLQLFGIQGGHAVPVNELLPIDETLMGDVHKRRKVQVRTSIGGRDEIDCKIMSDAQMQSYMVAPLKSGDECFGTLNVASQGADIYTPAEATMLDCIASWVGSHIRIYRHIELQQALTETDALTGLLNRTSFLLAGERVYDGWRDDAIPFVVAIFDIDRFKYLNDEYGRVGGDLVLVEFSKALKQMVRECDHVARLGAEEFAIILENMHEKNAKSWAERITDMISDLEVPFQETMISFTTSVGISAPRMGDNGIDPILSRCEQALSEAKDSGPNCVTTC